jgi:transcription elongation factor GreB
MSKAFTRESDDAPDQPVLVRPSPLPPGAKNYLTPGGERRLRGELHRLLETDRPPLAAMGTDAEAQRRIQLIDRRAQQLQQILDTAVVVPPPAATEEQVRFGATVTVREPDGEEIRYRIVGVDETDIDRDWVSWISPIAKALLNTKLGQKVRFKFPSGQKELEIVGITYEAE